MLPDRQFATPIFKPVNKILRCYHLNETSLVELLRGKIYFVSFHQKKFDCFGECFSSPL